MSTATNSPTPPADESGSATAAGRRREETIRAGVLAALGRPPRLFRVAVVRLWDDHFRVNVVTGDDATAVNIPNSYFLTANSAGQIVGSTPPIQKLY